MVSGCIDYVTMYSLIKFGTVTCIFTLYFRGGVF